MPRFRNGSQMPRSVAKRIMHRAACGEEAIVVTVRKGIPSRVFGLEEYLKMRELPRQVKPWQHRKSEEVIPDPLGAVEGTLTMPVTRENIYSDDE